MHQNIGEFAESLISSQVKGIAEGKAPVSMDKTWAEPNQRDITSIQVSDDFSHKVLQESFNVKPKSPAQKSVPITETQVLFGSTHEYESLLQRFNTIMEEAQSILEVFTGAGGGPGTSVGNLGTNFAGPGKKPSLGKRVRQLRSRRDNR